MMKPVPPAPRPWYAALAHGKRLTAAVGYLWSYRTIKVHSRTYGAREILSRRRRLSIHSRGVLCKLVTAGRCWWKSMGTAHRYGGLNDVTRCRICRSMRYSPREP